MSRRRASGSFFVMALLGALVVALPVRALEGAVEGMVLREDWGGLLSHAERSGGLGGMPRLILVHANLGTNRANAALCILAETSPEDLAAWDRWTLHLVKTHPSSPTANYLRGDALARQGSWDAAAASFSTALSLEPRHAISLNARGVVGAAKREWDDALLDFVAATQSRPGWAEAHASLGTMWIQRRTGGEGAVSAASEALRIVPNGALALNTRGCARLAVGDWEGARSDLERAGAQTACAAAIVAVNVVRINEYMDGRVTGGPGEGAGAEAGTTLENRVNAFRDNPTQWNANRLVSYLRENPADQGRAVSMIQGYAAARPDWGGRALTTLGRGINFNTEWAPAFLNLVRGVSVGAAGALGPVAIGLRYNFSAWADGQAFITKGNLMNWHVLQNAVANGMPRSAMRPGGVTTDLSGAFIDRGNWPLVAEYGLLYPSSR